MRRQNERGSRRPGLWPGSEADQTPPNLSALQTSYEIALAERQAADVRVGLANLDFQIRKMESLAGDDPELPAMKKQRQAMQEQLAAYQSQIKKLQGSQHATVALSRSPIHHTPNAAIRPP